MPQKTKVSDHQKVLLLFHQNRNLAHETLFSHRHNLARAPFHPEQVELFHSQEPRAGIEAFRGAAKSTIGEECVTLEAGYADFMNCVIVGSTETRAIERLESIKHEFENNEDLIELFGEQSGGVWQGKKIVLKDGPCIQALGVGQAVRGIKHLQFRPDLVWLDDIEDDDSVRTPEASHARLRWLYKTLLPVCAKHARVRITGNRLSPDAVLTKLAQNRMYKWMRVPIKYLSMETGQWEAAWPELYDMAWIEAKEQEYNELGLDQEWASEYMCEAIAQSIKPFKPEHYIVNARTRTFEPAIAIWDPAKTSKNLRHQAHYGRGVGSWVGRKLFIWELGAKAMMPSELIDDIFDTERRFQCMRLKVEKDGLDDWLMEPLRKEQLDRRILLPHLEAISAPKDKDGFIRSLEPFFESREIEFCCDLQEARSQMLNFPSGRKDILNVLAYFLKARPGQLIYTGFGPECIEEEMEISLYTNRYLVLNSDGTFLTAQLVQYDGVLQVMGDWVEAGDPGQYLERIIRQALLTATTDFEIVVPPKEFDKYQNKGIVSALRRIPRDCKNGNTYDRGREVIRELLSTRSDRPNLIVDPRKASWTMRALSGGYCYGVNSAGRPEEFAAEGVYRTLMEGLESFAGIMHHETEASVADESNFRVGRDGRSYRSLIGNRR